MKIKLLYIFSTFFATLLFVKCVEPYTAETSLYKDFLVIESTLTNKVSKQKVKLSRTGRLEIDTLIYENNASIWIEDSNSNKYMFSETEKGEYESDEEFKAQPDIGYTLKITTSDGKQYESREEYLTPEAEISDLYAEYETVNGEAGVQVYADISQNSEEVRYYRYEYDETYKIIMPYNIIYDVELQDVIISNYKFTYDVVFTITEEEKKVGYITDIQKEIILANRVNSSNNMEMNPVRFINANNHVLRDRYSILVKQFVQSQDSYHFYKTLKELGNTGNIFTENQPGFVNGNILPKDGSEDMVVGFFDVSSVSEKRIYFNYLDFNLDIPPYPYECQTDTLDYRDNAASHIDGDKNERKFLYDYLQYNPPWELLDVEYVQGYDDDGNLTQIPSIYIVLTPQCGNCTTISSNIKPEFWED